MTHQEPKARREELISELLACPSGLAWSRKFSRWIDTEVQNICKSAVEESGSKARFAIVALGGYGRQELCPYSDLDIILIPAFENEASLDSLVRKLYRQLHDLGSALSMPLGYTYRPILDAEGLDDKARTGMLDGRMVFGSSDLLQDMQLRLEDSLSVGEFILSKVNEREVAAAKFGATTLLVEPQLKEGPGGLRSFQAANWIRSALGERPLRTTHAYDLVQMFRNLLHACSRRPMDLLTRSKQAEIADIVQADMYEMMAGLCKQRDTLEQGYQEVLGKFREHRIPLSRSVVGIHGQARIMPDSDAGDAALGIAWATRLGLQIETSPTAPIVSVDHGAFLAALTHGEETIRNIDKCGLLGNVLPDLADCRYLMPRDGSHTYTVLEHTFKVIHFLDAMADDEFYGSIRKDLNDLSTLYLGALLHDIGKIDHARSHSEVGAEMCARIGVRLGLSEEVTQDLVWLVKEHLAMSKTIRLRDIYLEDTVADFAQTVGTPERLRLLTLLTAADIQAVGEGIWTLTQESFLKELFAATMHILEPNFLDAPQQVSRQQLRRHLKTESVSDEAVQDFLNSLPVQYLASTPPDLFKVHFQLVQSAQAGENTVMLQDAPNLGATDITICTKDQPGLLSKVLGVLYAYDLAPSVIRAATTSGATPIAIDVFTASFRGQALPPGTASHVEDTLKKVITGASKVDDVLRAHGKNPERHQEILHVNYVEGNPGILEIRAPRGRGMAYRVSRLLAGKKWNVVTARVGQWGGNAAAAFYVVDQDGNAIPEASIRELFA